MDQGLSQNDVSSGQGLELTDARATTRPAHRLVPILDNIQIARDTYRLRLGDAAMAGTIMPGQFVMIRPGPEGATDPLLGRPLALYEVICDQAGVATAFEVVYLVLGRGTAALSQRRPGDRIAVWGPLGNGFGPAPAGPVIFVAGGIGQTPFLALGRWWLGQSCYGDQPPRRGSLASESIAGQAHASRSQSPMRASAITLLYGVRTAALLAGVDDFRGAGFEVELATDDGTAGHHGFVTELLARRLERGEGPARIVGCGPPAMLASLAKIANQYNVPCEVSLENHMACGFGACFSCVAPIRQADGSTDLRRVCVEGPVVSADVVDWARLAH
jgi:dihydroorotate dehydrogenase electron transfer subunit